MLPGSQYSVMATGEQQTGMNMHGAVGIFVGYNNINYMSSWPMTLQVKTNVTRQLVSASIVQRCNKTRRRSNRQ